MKTLVLTLTLFRLISAPIIFICCIFLENFGLAFILFNIAAFTDFLDGKLARYHDAETELGAILDPIADKVLVVFSIIAVITFTQDSIVAIIGSCILAREFWVSGLREHNSSTQNSSATKVTFIAKTKTTFQFIALSMFFLGQALDLALLMFLANFVFFLALLFAFMSALTYSQNTFKL